MTDSPIMDAWRAARQRVEAAGKACLDGDAVRLAAALDECGSRIAALAGHADSDRPVIDHERRAVMFGEKVCPLRGLAFGLASRLLEARAGCWLSCAVLAADVWGDELTDTRAIQAAVSRLRAELRRACMPAVADAIVCIDGHYRVAL